MFPAQSCNWRHQCKDAGPKTPLTFPVLGLSKQSPRGLVWVHTFDFPPYLCPFLPWPLLPFAHTFIPSFVVAHPSQQLQLTPFRGGSQSLCKHPLVTSSTACALWNSQSSFLNLTCRNLSVFCHSLTSKCCFLGTSPKAHVHVFSTEPCFPGSLPTLPVLA